MSTTRAEMDALGEKGLAIMMYFPLIIFGCLAVIEEATFDLLDVLRDKEAA